jgi:predicted nucleic acid-binding protein
MKKTYVLDANALVALIEAGSGWQKVEDLLQSARRLECSIFMSVLNWGEVFYLLWRHRGEEVARQTMSALSRLPLQIVSVDLAQAMKAGELKATHKLPFVDSVAASLAILHQATLVTGDRDFEKLERHFPVLWIARQ